MDERDLRIDVWRTGALGQIWSLRLTHLPTGIVVDAEKGQPHDSMLAAKVALLDELQTAIRDVEQAKPK
jgi:protein subunit release factor A